MNLIMELQFCVTVWISNGPLSMYSSIDKILQE